MQLIVKAWVAISLRPLKAAELPLAVGELDPELLPDVLVESLVPDGMFWFDGPLVPKGLPAPDFIYAEAFDGIAGSVLLACHKSD